MNTNTLTIDNKTVAIENEKNLLEVIRKANIDVPTFCYHSELSVYGACRLCLVDVQGRGLQASCSVKPEPGMVVRTNTSEIRNMRKMTVELLLANGHQDCTSCPKNGACDLQSLARRVGIDKVRFKPRKKICEKDTSSPSLIRDPNKCVLCGDCVRYCKEIQGISAIDFTNRGSDTMVSPAFNRGLGEVECVNCGQCAAVCPTGAITPRVDVAKVWAAVDDQKKVVVAQVAPAVRVALGERFGLPAGENTIGKIVAALKMLGFDRVYDTSFTADLTVIEEANEFIARKTKGEKLPQFTSCCPAWVKFAEQYYPELLGKLSSCKSPQQMFGSVAKKVLPAELNVERENLYVVSIMPCTAKKYEAAQEKFIVDGQPDVDAVLTTQELAAMIEEAGLDFDKLQPESLDIPLGFKTGAGVIFGASGGVSEAVLRYAAEKVTGVKLQSADFRDVRGMGGLREASVKLGDIELKMAIVHGLRRAKALCEKVKAGECDYDIIEVMACPGGCIGGAGQPVTRDMAARQQRSEGLYKADKMLQLHKSQDNHYVMKLYDDCLGEVGGKTAHHLLHTHYASQRRLAGEDIELVPSTPQHKFEVAVCVGTGCYTKGSQDILSNLIRYIEERGLGRTVSVRGTFCFEKCGKSPNVKIGDDIISACTTETAIAALEEKLAQLSEV